MNTKPLDETKPVDSAHTNFSAEPVDTGDTKRPADKSTSFENFPATKAEVISYVTDYVAGLSVGDAMELWNKLVATQHAADATYHGKVKGTDSAEFNKSTIKTYKEDLDALLSGIELPEEFKEKASTIFHAVVATKITEETAKLEEKFDANIEASTNELKAELEEKVTAFISTYAEKYIEENKVAIVSELRIETAKSFIEGMKSLFAEHYISLPEERVDVVEALNAEVDDLEEKLNAEINEKVELSKKIRALETEKVLEGLIADLPDTQKEKVRSMAETLEVTLSVDEFSAKVATLKEAVAAPSTAKPLTENAGLDDEVTPEEKKPVQHATIASYLDALKRTKLR